MRRTDKEVTDFEVIDQILQQCNVLRLGFWDGNEPYVVPVNFGYEKKTGDEIHVYAHGALAGRKIEIIKNGHTRVAIQMDCANNLKLNPSNPCDSTMEFMSVMGAGNVHLLEGEDKRRGLEIIFEHLSGIVPDLPPHAEDRINVLCVELDWVTAKRWPNPKSSS